MKKEQFRNALHILIGAALGWVLFQTFDGVVIPVQIFLTVLVIGIIGTMWEWGWEMYSKAPVDYWDVKWSVIGALVIQIIYTIW
jgi:hypothetical protein